MAVSYVSKKCPSCASTKFVEDKGSKIWVCAYCGTVIERHEEADTLYTIKNIVQQVILDLSYCRFDSAKKNIVECEKIDSKYIGTIIAKVCYYVNALQFESNSESEKRNLFAQLKKHYLLLSQNSNQLSEEEKILYEFFDSAEVFGALILAYDTLGDEVRRNFLYDKFKPQDVYSTELNLNLLRFMINNNQLEIADKIVDNTDNIDQCEALQMLLEIYPDSQQKVDNCTKLINNDIVPPDSRNIYEYYFENSSDSFIVKYQIAEACCKSSAYPSVKCIMKNIIVNTDDVEHVKSLFASIMTRKLADEEVYTIIEFAFEKSNEEVALYIIELLSSTKQFVVLNKQHFIVLLENTKINATYKQKIIEVALNFNVTSKVKEQFVSYYLNSIKDQDINRKVLIPYLLSLVDTISTNSAENYIINNNYDGSNKPEIVRMIMKSNINKSFFRDTFDKYILQNSDSLEISDRIIEILSESGLRISELSIVKLLTSNSYNEEKKINLLRRFKSGGANFISLADKYIFYVSPNLFSPNIFSEILECSNSISLDSFRKYLLNIRDAEAQKAINAKKLLEKCHIPVVNISCSVNHLNMSIECGILQGYILVSQDSPEVTMSVLNSLTDDRIKLNTDIMVSGVRYKFKKYLKEKRTSLGNTTTQVALRYGLI